MSAVDYRKVEPLAHLEGYRKRDGVRVWIYPREDRFDVVYNAESEKKRRTCSYAPDTFCRQFEILAHPLLGGNKFCHK